MEELDWVVEGWDDEEDASGGRKKAVSSLGRAIVVQARMMGTEQEDLAIVLCYRDAVWVSRSSKAPRSRRFEFLYSTLPSTHARRDFKQQEQIDASMF